jgi:PHD/YefM family antitoxin component YafN of YafNO toxin-antitoxin module
MIDKLKESQEPIVLTINGRAEVVVQDAGSYQKLLDQVHQSEDLEAIRDGLAQSLRGVGRPSSDFFREFESENGL